MKLKHFYMIDKLKVKSREKYKQMPKKIWKNNQKATKVHYPNNKESFYLNSFFSYY